LQPPDLDLVRPLVVNGALHMGKATACIMEWQERTKTGGEERLTLIDVLVEKELLTATQGLVLSGAPLEDHQPIPDYRLLRKVGEGGMAHVYEATYEPVDARVALKILLPEFCLQERYRLRFKREAQLLLHLDHPVIVDGREHATVDGVDYYAMGFVDGIAVADLMEEGVELTEGMALHVACQVGEALEHMRQKGVIHRDIKPHNMVLAQDGAVHIIDFGLAKLVTGMREDTAENVTVGTVEYMSPEQCRGLPGVDIRSDLYSLGCSVFHMCTGDLPYQGDQREIMIGHVRRELELSREQRARISPQVQFVIRKMMAKEPDDRYATPQECVDDLRAVAGDLIANRGPVPAHVAKSGIETAPIDLGTGPAGPTKPLPKLRSTRPSASEIARGEGGRREGRGRDGKGRSGRRRRR
jgi:serine/threonine-protein kinase